MVGRRHAGIDLFGGRLTSLEFSRSRVERFVSLNEDFGTMGHAIKSNVL